MDPQYQTAPLGPRRSQSYPVFDSHVNSHFIQHSPVYSLYTFAQQPNAMGVDRSQRQVQPPRPPNAWILYRSDKIKQLPPLEPGAPRRAQADVSKLISRMWREENEVIKAEYEKRADVKKAEHQAKYPNYRFQPMKKSEKEKLREQSKAEKDKGVGKSRRSAPYRSTIPPPQATSSYSIAAPTPISYSIGLLPTLYPGQIAPSPPLSAASSTPSSPTLFPTLHLDPEISNAQAPQNFPTDPHTMRSHSVPSHPMSRQVSSTSSATVHTPSSSGYMLPSTPSQAPSPAGGWPPSAFNWDPQPSPATWVGSLPQDESVPAPPQDQGLQLTFEEPSSSQAPTFISLEMPQLPEPSQPDIQGWTPEDSSMDFMRAVLSATGDPSIFQVSFDPTLLTSEPPEGLHMSYANLGEPSSSNSWPPTFAPAEHSYLNAGENTTYTADRVGDIPEEISPQQHAEMMQYLNFNYHAVAEDSYPLEAERSSSAPVASSSTSYVPPTGAFNSGRRVVAGSWKPSGFFVQESPPGSPIQHPTGPWGVRAVS